jgi:hypothetical protein
MPATINTHAAKTQFSRLFKRAARVEETKPGTLLKDDPLPNLFKFGFEGSGGALTNREIDQIVYGA